ECGAGGNQVAGVSRRNVLGDLEADAEVEATVREERLLQVVLEAEDAGRDSSYGVLASVAAEHLDGARCELAGVDAAATADVEHARRPEELDQRVGDGTCRGSLLGGNALLVEAVVVDLRRRRAEALGHHQGPQAPYARAELPPEYRSHRKHHGSAIGRRQG